MLLMPGVDFAYNQTSLDESSGAWALGAIGRQLSTSSAHTKTAWSELVASTTNEFCLIAVTIHHSFIADTNSSWLVDVGIGAAGSEVVLIPNLIGGFTGSAVGLKRHYVFPIRIPAGSRLAVRGQAPAGSRTCRVFCSLYGGPSDPTAFRVGTGVVAYGVNTAVSGGTPVSSAQTNYASSWTELTSGTSEDHFCLVPAIQPNATGTLADQHFVYQYAQGAAGQEDIFWHVYHGQSASETSTGPMPPIPIAKRIPKGTRLAARGKCDNSSPHNSQHILYGVY